MANLTGKQAVFAASHNPHTPKPRIGQEPAWVHPGLNVFIDAHLVGRDPDEARRIKSEMVASIPLKRVGNFLGQASSHPTPDPAVKADLVGQAERYVAEIRLLLDVAIAMVAAAKVGLGLNRSKIAEKGD
jgi:hypothetical protein